jgi:predicted RNase H-like HicB family nuclease
MVRQLPAIIEKEGDGYVALCPDVDVASQGATIDESRRNIQEALELFFETASPQEIQAQLHEEVYVTHVTVHNFATSHLCSKLIRNHESNESRE